MYPQGFGDKKVSNENVANQIGKIDIIWKVIAVIASLFLTIAMQRFFAGYDEQIAMQGQILLEVRDIKVQMEAADFKKMRREIDSLQINVTRLESRVNGLQAEIERKERAIYGKN